MHFRDRKSSIQLVRTSYDETTKKPKSEVLGRLSRPKLEVSEELSAKFTPEEKSEVETYRARVLGRETAEQTYVVTRFPETLKLVTAWLSSADAAETSQFADDIHQPLRKLRQKLAKIASA